MSHSMAAKLKFMDHYRAELRPDETITGGFERILRRLIKSGETYRRLERETGVSRATIRRWCLARGIKSMGVRAEYCKAIAAKTVRSRKKSLDLDYVLIRVFDGLNLRAIASELGCSYPMLSAQVHEARKRGWQVDRDCRYCGEVFTPSHIDRFLCSRRCTELDMSWRIRFARDGFKAVRVGDVRECRLEGCNNRWEAKNTRQIFCGRKCQQTDKNRRKNRRKKSGHNAT